MGLCSLSFGEGPAGDFWDVLCSVFFFMFFVHVFNDVLSLQSVTAN